VRRAVAAAVLAALLGPAGDAGARTLHVSGSPSAAPLVADLAFYYRRAEPRAPAFDLVGGGSSSGIADVARGISDVGLSSRARLPADPASVRFTPFARSAICLVTDKANPVASLTRAQVAQLVDARTTSWTQVAGAVSAGPVVPAALASGSGGDTDFLSRLVDLATPVTYVPRTFATPSQLGAFVAATPSAWGYADLAFTYNLHVVALDGVPCDRAHVADGTYGGGYDLAFVTRGAPRGAVARFLRWVRTSATARRVIAARHLPRR
jgi:phosphate transport system substrate-binding protein